MFSQEVHCSPPCISEWMKFINSDAPHSSNQPSLNLPYQRWYRFKEAYSPQLVTDIVNALDYTPTHIVDPFGGCGTSAVTSQFLGITPTAIEVNPFLADLTEAKLTQYDLNEVMHQKKWLLKAVKSFKGDTSFKDEWFFPETFCEPGTKDKWIFPKALFEHILAYRYLIEAIKDQNTQRLFRIILGSTLIPLSNVYISGKGRKYRSNWQKKQSTPSSLDSLFEVNLDKAISDIQNFGSKHSEYQLFRGDCLARLSEIDRFDLSIFSPPYPNSFDYTDVYNVELWMLGYISSHQECSELRRQTLRSHVQVKRSYDSETLHSKTLTQIIQDLKENKLWHKDLPDMVPAYFDDLFTLLKLLRLKIEDHGNIIMVVGDSSYNSIKIPVADIIEEFSELAGFKVKEKRVVRKLRQSPQQGGGEALDESLVWLTPSL